VNNEPKISVIVPVYKVEPYLRKCLDSIINQTYKNLQIILVDDGSPDNCGRICDEYAAKDKRIAVLHQENKGVSAARNAGLALADGEYLGFVDSDDWIEPDMYAYLLNNLRGYGADIAVCGRLECYKKKKIFKGWQNIKLLNKERAMEKLLQSDTMNNLLWDKLWRKELFAGVTFPEGRTFEDIAVMHRLFAKSNRVVCLPEAKYNYRQWLGGIVNNTSLHNRINYYLAAKERYMEMSEAWPQFEPLLQMQCVNAAVGIWCAYLSNRHSERVKFRDEIFDIAVFCKGHYKQALQNSNMGFIGRAVLRLTPYAKWWAFVLAWLWGRLYRLRHGRNL